MTASSFTLAGTPVKCLPFPQPIIQPAWTPVIDDSGIMHSSDRGVSQDVYLSNVIFQGPENEINIIANLINSNRGTITLSAFNVQLFSPNVDHTGSISCSIETPIKLRKQLVFGNPYHVYILEVVFRALSPALLSPTPSLSKLKLNHGFTADHLTAMNKDYTYSQSPIYEDKNDDPGYFNGLFVQNIADMQAILAYFLVTSRGASFTFPTISGLTYPFGYSRGTGPFKVANYSMKLQRKNLNRYTLLLELKESI